MAIFTPYPGSELYDQLRDSGAIPKVDDDYIANLILQFDFTVAKSYSPHIPGWEAALYRLAGMALFYGVSYMLHPGRLWRLATNIRKTDFQPRTIIEQRLFDIMGRRRIEAEKGSPLSSPAE